jgi:hypothetical protein
VRRGIVSKATQLLKEVFDRAIGGQLRSLGFVESPAADRHPFCPQQYERRLPSLVQMVDIQRDKYWEASGGKFCINLNVFFEDLAWPYSVSQDGKNRNGCWERLGRLAKSEDYWWLLSTTERPQELIRELASIWHRFGEPWFEAHRDLRSARDFALLDSFKRISAIKMSVALGELDVARHLTITVMKGGYRPENDWLAELVDWNVLKQAEADVVRRLAMQRVDHYLAGLDVLFRVF